MAETGPSTAELGRFVRAFFAIVVVAAAVAAVLPAAALLVAAALAYRGNRPSAEE